MANHDNERLKRRYFAWLRGAKGYSERTVATIERAIHQFEESNQYRSFKTFSERQATTFKDWLSGRVKNGKSISNGTKYHQLRHVQAFFMWLATQPGYKSKVSLDAVSYLSLDRRTVREVLSPRPRKYPSLEQIKTLVNSIEAHTDIDRRDRAMIAFLILSGIRYSALCSLSVGCFDVERRVVLQDPRLGVKTKGGKVITTWLLPFDDQLTSIVCDWAKYLPEERRFASTDPLFPRTRIVQSAESLSFEACGIEPVFWSGGNSVRTILRERSQAAGLPYFPPHSYRHAACQLAIRMAKSPEEYKALSENFGHEEILTTLRTYGNLGHDRVAQVISNMSSGKKLDPGAEKFYIEDLIDFANSRRKGLDR